MGRADAALLWYFAYGSNLDPRTFLGRRRMRPLEARPSVLADHRLVFDLPIGPGERAVANLLSAPRERVHGVAYLLGASQASFLDRTEGVPRAYQRAAVELETGAERLSAFTYVSPHRRQGRKPSRRYMRLLLDGARHHALPDAWLDHLRSFELAVDERSAQQELFDQS